MVRGYGPYGNEEVGVRGGKRVCRVEHLPWYYFDTFKLLNYWNVCNKIARLFNIHPKVIILCLTLYYLNHRPLKFIDVIKTMSCTCKAAFSWISWKWQHLRKLTILHGSSASKTVLEGPIHPIDTIKIEFGRDLYFTSKLSYKIIIKCNISEI